MPCRASRYPQGCDVSDAPDRAEGDAGLQNRSSALLRIWRRTVLGVSDLATDGDGNLYFVDANNDRVQKFDSAGTRRCAAHAVALRGTEMPPHSRGT
jgi:hypothetical protein